MEEESQVVQEYTRGAAAGSATLGEKLKEQLINKENADKEGDD